MVVVLNTNRIPIYSFFINIIVWLNFHLIYQIVFYVFFAY